jgi:hypothetical protein
MVNVNIFAVFIYKEVPRILRNVKPSSSQFQVQKTGMVSGLCNGIPGSMGISWFGCRVRPSKGHRHCGD